MSIVHFKYTLANDDIGGFHISMEVASKGEFQSQISYNGRTHLPEKNIALLGARWKCIIEAMIKNNARIDDILLLEAWFASNCLPERLEDRFIADRARGIIGQHLEEEILREIYQTAA